MDGQFNTLVRSYHDNFLQYKLTGNASYKQAYEGAQQGIDSILEALQKEVDSQRSKVSQFYANEDKIRQTQSDLRDAKRNVVTERDQLEGAKLRETGSISSTSLQSRYIALAVLGVIALGITAMR